MSFFDSKQETLNIELTSYGKMLLSKGKFKPVYYAFYDDDVIYDASYINITESQNEIVQRIMNETPVSKPQYIFVGVDQTANKNVELFSEFILEENNVSQIKDTLKVLEPQNISEKKYALSSPLGKSSFNSEYYPAWHINLLSGTISSSYSYVDNSDGFMNSLQPYLKIPQINLNDGVHQVLLTKDSEFETAPEDYENIGFIIDSNGDTTSINLKTYQYLLEVMEKNVDDVKENFDIEVFIEESGSQSINWKQLSFIKQPVYIKNNILLDTPEEPKNSSEIYKNPNFVEHYLKILIDDEIILPPKQSIKVQAYDSKVTPDVVGEDC